MADKDRPSPAEQSADHDQPAPGSQRSTGLQPDSDLSNYKAAGKLDEKVAVNGRGRTCPTKVAAAPTLLLTFRSGSEKTSGLSTAALFTCSA